MQRVVIPYRPRYPDVHEAMSARRFFVLVAHRRFGKTVIAINHLIRQALASPRPDGHFAYVAPFRNQAKSIAWSYMKRYTARVPGRRVNESELSVSLPSSAGGSRIRIFGADNPDALRGLYFDGVILDEVAQMKPDVWEEIIQPALADRQGWAVFIGTPKGINLFSQLYHHALEEQARGSSLWGAMRFPVTSTNTLPEEEVARLEAELSASAYRQEMLCDFTASSDNTLISIDSVTQALERSVDPAVARQWPLIIGVDVARFGEDATVFFPRAGLMAMPPTVLTKRSNLDISHLLLNVIAEMKPQAVCIDQGQGTGVIDIVQASEPGCAVHEVPFGSQALCPERFVNRRAEMWDRMRQWLEHGSLPQIAGESLTAELTAPRYDFDARGRIRLEAKDEIRKRLRHSTDLGDALALTFAIQISPASKRHRKNAGPYNPFGQLP